MPVEPLLVCVCPAVLPLTFFSTSRAALRSVSELFSPVSGEIVEVNEALGDTPETVNEDPYGDGWMVKIKIANTAEVDALMTADEYEAFLAEEA